LKNELKDSISTFNQATEDTRVKYISVANSYLKKLNTDNQQQDFKQALDAKFKAMDKQMDQLIHELKKRNEQAENEIQTYKQKLESRFKDNNKLVEKFNKSIDVSTKGITSLFYVIVIIALITFVTGPIGHFLGVESLYSLINDFIDDHKSPWRYLMGILYLVPYVCFTLILLAVAKVLGVIQRY